MCRCGKTEATIKFESDEGFIPLCDKQKCKDLLIQDLEDYEFRMTHQGRSRERYESSVQINIVAVIAFGSILAAVGIYYLVKALI